MKIKKLAALTLAGALMCTAPAAVYAQEDVAAAAQEVLENNQIESLISDPDKVVDIIVYVKDYIGNQEISDDTIREAIDMGCSTLGISLDESDKESLISIFKKVKDMDLDEEQLRSQVTKVYEGLESLGIGKEEVKGILELAIDFVKGFFE